MVFDMLYNELSFNQFWWVLPSPIMKGFLIYNIIRNSKNNNRVLQKYLSSVYSLRYIHASEAIEEYGSVGYYKGNPQMIHISFVFVHGSTTTIQYMIERSASTDPYLTFNLRTLTHEITHAHIEFARQLKILTDVQASSAHRLLHDFDVYGIIPDDEFVDVYSANYRWFRVINADKVIRVVRNQVAD